MSVYSIFRCYYESRDSLFTDDWLGVFKKKGDTKDNHGNKGHLLFAFWELTLAKTQKKSFLGQSKLEQF